MFNDIKITMLGASTAGKTCFMVGMYAVMRDGVRGFTFSTQDADDDLELSERWEKMLDPGADRWPLSTVESKNYRFDFNFGFKAIMGFEWHDYRGKALADKSQVADVQQLLAHLKGSSCVLLCVSGEHLAKGGRERLATASARAGIARMNLRLPELAREAERTGTSRPAVVVVLTKYDLCSHRPEAEVLAEVRELFNPLFTPGCGWTATICPVSLGEGLSQDLEEGAIAPVKVHLPVAFSIYCVLKREVAARRSRRNRCEASSLTWKTATSSVVGGTAAR